MMPPLAVGAGPLLLPYHAVQGWLRMGYDWQLWLILGKQTIHGLKVSFWGHNMIGTCISYVQFNICRGMTTIYMYQVPHIYIHIYILHWWKAKYCWVRPILYDTPRYFLRKTSKIATCITIKTYFSVKSENPPGPESPRFCAPRKMPQAIDQEVRLRSPERSFKDRFGRRSVVFRLRRAWGWRFFQKRWLKYSMIGWS